MFCASNSNKLVPLGKVSLVRDVFWSLWSFENMNIGVVILVALEVAMENISRSLFTFHFNTANTIFLKALMCLRDRNETRPKVIYYYGRPFLQWWHYLAAWKSIWWFAEWKERRKNHVFLHKTLNGLVKCLRFFMLLDGLVHNSWNIHWLSFVNSSLNWLKYEIFLDHGNACCNNHYMIKCGCLSLTQYGT